ncbi:MAG: hypothetical protein P8J27_17590 [Mariniblastus sp.]|nr:hypothetical protein [Mariniblastus sp.]
MSGNRDKQNGLLARDSAALLVKQPEQLRKYSAAPVWVHNFGPAQSKEVGSYQRQSSRRDAPSLYRALPLTYRQEVTAQEAEIGAHNAGRRRRSRPFPQTSALSSGILGKKNELCPLSSALKEKS